MLLCHSHRLLADYLSKCDIWESDYHFIRIQVAILIPANGYPTICGPSLEWFGHRPPNRPKRPPCHLPEWQQRHCWKTELQGHLPGLRAEVLTQVQNFQSSNRVPIKAADWTKGTTVTMADNSQAKSLNKSCSLQPEKTPRNCSSLFWCCPHILGHPRLSSCQSPRTKTQRHCTLRQA